MERTLSRDEAAAGLYAEVLLGGGVVVLREGGLRGHGGASRSIAVASALAIGGGTALPICLVLSPLNT